MPKQNFSSLSQKTILHIINNHLCQAGEIDEKMMECMEKEIESLEISRESSYNESGSVLPQKEKKYEYLSS